jgi:SAM-dependent methyltransferase
LLRFTCNICNTVCTAETPEELDREIPSCPKCKSNVRFRWIVHALSTGLFGESIPLGRFPRRKKICGIGLSDETRLAAGLARRLAYRNTFYHREPHFNIMDPTRGAQYDFIIASEVFEHVLPPVQTAFNNLARLLKPGAFAIFSTPWHSEGETIEHFPEIYDWQIVRLQTGFVLVNRTRGGVLQTFENLVFHGGPGSTLEIRMFSRDGLLANCRAAGFTDIAIAEDYPEYGIVWVPWSRGMVLRKPLV